MTSNLFVSAMHQHYLTMNNESHVPMLAAQNLLDNAMQAGLYMVVTTRMNEDAAHHKLVCPAIESRRISCVGHM